MSASKPYLVLNAYVEKGETIAGYTHVVTAAGESLLIESKGIGKIFPVEATGEKGLMRIFVKQDANIWLGVSPEIIKSMSGGVSQVGDDTITKYLDDGGTISKSRDDTFSVGSQL